MNREKLETIFTDADITSILTTQFGIQDPEIEKLSGGTESQAWRVTERSRSWIAKVFLSEENHAWLEEEFNLYRYLNTRGFHTPIVRESNKGLSVESVQRGGETLDVVVMRGETLRRAEPSAVTKEELTTVVRSIASLHKVLMQYPNRRAYQEKTNIEKPQSEYPESAFEALARSVHARHFSERQRKTFQDVDVTMLTAVRTRVSRESLTCSIIHGDLALEHAQFLPDLSVYFFDFGDRIWAPVARELGIFLTMLYQWEDISFNRWERLKQWVIDSYESVFPLTTNDKNAIPYFEIKRLLGAMSYLATLAKDTENEHTVHWIRRGYELGEHLINRNISEH